MAVIANDGVVGRVVIPSGRAAKVQLLIDRNAAVGALIERSRAQGVAMGGGDGRLQLEFVSETADVVVGDLVVTSGIDGIFPKGFTIGPVDMVEKTGPSYKRITIKPAVDFSSTRRGAGRPDADAGTRGRGGPRVKAAGIILAIALALVLQTTLARFLVRGTVARGPCAGRRGVRRADVGVGDGTADRDRRRTDSGLAVDRSHRHRRTGEDDGRLSGRASSGRSSSSLSRCRGSSCFSRRRCCTRRSRLAWALCWACGRSVRPTPRSPGQALGNAVVGVAAFQLVELLPGAVERRRMARTRLRR